MSVLKEYDENLKKIVEQRRSIIHIQTDDCQSETERVKGIIRKLYIETKQFKKEDVNIWLPDGSGLRRLYGGEVQEDGLCESLRSLPIQTNDSYKSILIIRNLNYFYDSRSDSTPQISSLLERFYAVNEKRERENRSFIIIISPKFDMTSEIMGCIYTIMPPYPDEKDIEEELGLCAISDTSTYRKKQYEPEGKPYRFAKQFFINYEDNKRNLINALKGLRICEIRKILAYGDEPYLIRGFDIESFEKNKKRMVEDSGLLKVENVPEHYYEYVGDIGALKEYMETEKGVIDNRTYYNDKMPLPKGILLVGPPGCGKSETSKAIASILGLPLYSMDMGRLLGNLMGQSEQNFDRALSIAEAAQPCVLRIDEIEKAFSGSGEHENDQTMTHIVGHFLTWMQERQSMVYLVATANNLEMLRPEFLRKGRWDEIFYLSYPTANGMKDILKSCLKKYNLRMEDGDEDTGEDEHDENGNIIERSPIGKDTKRIIDDLYKNNQVLQISGAEIVDVVEQIYKSQFVDAQQPGNNKIASSKKAKVIPTGTFYHKLIMLSEKQRDVELFKAIDRDVLDIKINHLLKSKYKNEHLDKEILKILLTKYNEGEINRLVDSELASLEINCILNGTKGKFEENRKSIEVILQRKFNKNTLIRNDLAEIHLNMLMQEEIMDDTREKELKMMLKEKYKNEHIEDYYKARGYRPASKESTEVAN